MAGAFVGDRLWTEKPFERGGQANLHRNGLYIVPVPSATKLQDHPVRRNSFIFTHTLAHAVIRNREVRYA